MDLNKYLDVIFEALEILRPMILDIYHSPFDVALKSDDSPVTRADLITDQFLINHLRKHFPEHAFLTEESKDNLARLHNDYVWIIDPIDGTKDFIGKDNEFTTNIALSYKHEIVLGVIFAPVSGDIYYALKNNGSYVIRNGKPCKIHVSSKSNDLHIVRSRYHFKEKEQEFIDKNKDIITKVSTIGAALKACAIAEGKADISYRSSDGTKEWDTAASQIIVEEAGGFFLKPDGSRYSYNREDVHNREGYFITNKREHLDLL
ncbi:MAG: 3'(2'),5'-bisphosphate nucleotidase CysQ family protein [Bacilli bacterium]|jgi:3'(2'), 5'-bisphosphate nucleotidase